MRQNYIRTAFEVLEQLDQMKGQARNRRLQVLINNRENPVLLEIFRLSYDWRIELGIVAIGLEQQFIGSNPGYQLLESSWVEFRNLISDTQVGGGFLTNRKKFSKFLERAHPIVGKWTQRILHRDLRIFLSIKMINRVWSDTFVPFHAPPSKNARLDGVRTLIFIQNHQSVAYTERFRKFHFANDAFGKQIARVCQRGIIEGIVTSTDWDLSSSLLSHHVSSIGKSGFKALFYGLRFDATNYYDPDEFYRGIFRPNGAKLDAIIQALNPGTSISNQRKSQPFNEVDHEQTSLHLSEGEHIVAGHIHRHATT